MTEVVEGLLLCYLIDGLVVERGYASDERQDDNLEGV